MIPAKRLRKIAKSAIRRIYDAAPPGSINLGLGETDLQTPEPVRHEAIRAIEQELNGYTPNAGLDNLRLKIAAYHGEDFGSRLDADSVCVTNGAQEALFAATMSIAGPGDEVLVPDPGFLAYPVLAELAGAKVIRYGLAANRCFEFDPDEFSRAVTRRTKLVFINSPSNPTGRVIPERDLEFIADRLANSAAFVISDEIYREIHFANRPASIARFYDRTVVVSGLSKMMSMTGWRLGWAVGPKEIISHITVMHQYISSCASTISQKAAIMAFSDEARNSSIAIREELRRRRQVMIDELERLGLPFICGEGAFYAMLNISRFGTSEEIAHGLLRHRVITVPGSAFGPRGEGYLRLSFSIEPEAIREGIRRIRAGLGL
jgi:aspartate/methionine/tyrosine aminotransferase